MKPRSFVIAFSLVIVTNVNAQMSTVFIRGGANIASVTATNLATKPVISFQFGLIGNVPINPSIAFQPGLIFTGKGTKSQAGNTSDNTYYEATSNPYYVEIPANLVFKTGSAGYTRFVAGAGPYLGIGVAGKVKSNGKLMGSSFHNEMPIEWSNDDPSTLNDEEGGGFGIMKRFDYGVNATAGIETLYVVITANYGFGLAPLQNVDISSANKNKHRVFSLTVGIRLGAWSWE
jgi:hypothetical protein